MDQSVDLIVRFFDHLAAAILAGEDIMRAAHFFALSKSLAMNLSEP